MDDLRLLPRRAGSAAEGSAMSDFPSDKILVDHYTVALGPDGSVSIPEDWREFFGEGKSVGVLMLPAPGPSIWLFAARDAEPLRAIDERAPPDKETAKYLSQLGRSCEAVLTSKYALPLSARLRRWLGIRKQAILIGCYDHAEIMSSKTWKRIDLPMSESLALAARELGL